jgi:diacylglycerol kinase (CTP)
MSSQIPSTPRVISPSPTPSETSGKDGYFPPTTRSKAVRMSSVGSIDPIEELRDDHLAEEEDPELARARARSRSPQIERKPRDLRMGMNGTITTSSTSAKATAPTRRKKAEELNRVPNGQVNGFLSPDSAYPKGFGSAYWRNLSRSPSPLGLIPIHREWKMFIHKHEIPRKALHVSIGFLGLWLYYEGAQPDQIHPVLLSALVPIFAIDLLRFKWDALNRAYIKTVGALMRESEAHDRFNGVISYLAGLWVTLRFCRKDVAIVSVLLLSWCDTAASTFGRLWGKYTPRIRRGKSMAGSLAAFVVGVASAALFWGVLAPNTGGTFDEGINRFAYQGMLTLPTVVRDQLKMSLQQASITGWTALIVLSLASGLVVSVSEAIDLWGLDDNLTIPILCGIGLTWFLWCCGDIGS